MRLKLTTETFTWTSWWNWTDSKKNKCALCRHFSTTFPPHAWFGKQNPSSSSPLLHSHKHPETQFHTGVRRVMNLAGIPKTFKPYSTRSASASKNALLCHSLQDMLKFGKWRTSSTFFKHYLRQPAYFDKKGNVIKVPHRTSQPLPEHFDSPPPQSHTREPPAPVPRGRGRPRKKATITLTPGSKEHAWRTAHQIILKAHKQKKAVGKTFTSRAASTAEKLRQIAVRKHAKALKQQILKGPPDIKVSPESNRPTLFSSSPPPQTDFTFDDLTPLPTEVPPQLSTTPQVPTPVNHPVIHSILQHPVAPPQLPTQGTIVPLAPTNITSNGEYTIVELVTLPPTLESNHTISTHDPGSTGTQSPPVAITALPTNTEGSTGPQSLPSTDRPPSPAETFISYAESELSHVSISDPAPLVGPDVSSDSTFKPPLTTTKAGRKVKTKTLTPRTHHEPGPKYTPRPTYHSLHAKKAALTRRIQLGKKIKEMHRQKEQFSPGVWFHYTRNGILKNSTNLRTFPAASLTMVMDLLHCDLSFRRQISVTFYEKLHSLTCIQIPKELKHQFMSTDMSILVEQDKVWICCNKTDLSILRSLQNKHRKKQSACKNATGD